MSQAWCGLCYGGEGEVKMKNVKITAFCLHNPHHPDSGQEPDTSAEQIFKKNINLTDRMSEKIPGDQQCVFTRTRNTPSKARILVN